MKKFEYKMLSTDDLVKLTKGQNGNIYDKLYQSCKILGKEGWELVVALDNPLIQYYQFYFKREYKSKK